MDPIEARNRQMIDQLAAGTFVPQRLQIQPGDESRPANSLGNFFLQLVGANPKYMQSAADYKQASAELPQKLAAGTMGTTGKIISGSLEAILAKQASGKALSTAEQLALQAAKGGSSGVFNVSGIAQNTAGRVPVNPGFAYGGQVKSMDLKNAKHSKAMKPIAAYAEGGEVPAQDIRIMSPEEQQQYDPSSPSPASALSGANFVPAPEPQNIQLQPQPQQPPLMPQDPNMIQQSLAEQVGGLQKQAAAESQLGKAQESAAAEQARKADELSQQYQANYNHLEEQRQAIMHDIQNGQIDPNRYVNNLGTGGKIASAIGIFLGGLNPHGNAALDFFNKQIERDVDSQKANLGKQENLLHAVNAQFNNLHDSTNAMRVIYASKYAADIEKAAAASKDPMAQARAQQLVGQLHAQYAPLMQQMALRQTLFQGAQSGHIAPEQAVQYLVPQQHQKQVFSEIERAQNAKHNEGAILENFDKAAKENTVLRRVGHLGAEPASLANTRNLLMPILKDNEGRINETEIGMMEDFLPKAGDTDAKIAQKRQGLIKFIQAKKAAPTAKGFGLDLEKFPSTAPRAEGVRPNPNAGYGR